MTTDTQERMKHTFHTIMALLRHLDHAQREGEERYEHKGQLIKTAGQLRDEIGRENVTETINEDKLFALLEDTDD